MPTDTEEGTESSHTSPVCCYLAFAQLKRV